MENMAGGRGWVLGLRPINFANERKTTYRAVTGNQIISTGLNLTGATATQIVDGDFRRKRRIYGY